MLKMRHKVITFPSSELKSSLDGLKLTKKVHWELTDYEYMVALYKTGEKR